MSDIDTVKEHCKTAHEEVDRRFESIERDLRGNGHPGLVADMAAVKVEVETLAKAVASLAVRMGSTEKLLAAGVGILSTLQVVLKFFV